MASPAHKPVNSSAPHDGRRTLKADTLAASVVILLAVTVIQRSVGFGRGILFCRWLSPEVLGQWEMAYSFLLFAAPLAVLGVPGSFGRYAEHYRARGHLRTFLRRATAWTVGCAGIAMLLAALLPGPLAVFVFGEADNAPVVRGMSLCLGAIILHHTVTSVLTALRLYRVVSAMNLVQSLLFAVVSLAMLWRGQSVSDIITAYGAACLAASLGALVWAWPGFRGLEPAVDALPQREFWPKLLRFAFFLWVTNLLTHLFALVDRYMIIHCSGMSPAEALEQVGHYHSSRIVPLLLVSVADLLSGLIMPHLSHDWEAGRRESVSFRMALAVKLTSLGMLACGGAVLAAGPLLFGTVLQGRYDEGLAVLPWTLAGCMWYAIYSVSQNYLWCAERTRLSTAPLACGLVVNVILNFMLLPMWGLLGAVVATAISTSVCLALSLALSRVHGMQVDRGVWIAAATPAALVFGTAPALIATAALILLAPTTSLVFSRAERDKLKQLALDGLEKIRALLPARRLPAGV
ncbi:MAG: lipopolysaccharide biosynthesis protein [Pirellulales bacterium]|nr:lipopolysaccharide biosynthesis protein [Pirellulales bacterium]